MLRLLVIFTEKGVLIINYLRYKIVSNRSKRMILKIKKLFDIVGLKINKEKSATNLIMFDE